MFLSVIMSESDAVSEIVRDCQILSLFCNSCHTLPECPIHCQSLGYNDYK